jgi:hypothetical protein
MTCLVCEVVIVTWSVEHHVTTIIMTLQWLKFHYMDYDSKIIICPPSSLFSVNCCINLWSSIGIYWLGCYLVDARRFVSLWFAVTVV